MGTFKGLAPRNGKTLVWTSRPSQVDATGRLSVGTYQGSVEL